MTSQSSAFTATCACAKFTRAPATYKKSSSSARWPEVLLGHLVPCYRAAPKMTGSFLDAYGLIHGWKNAGGACPRNPQTALGTAVGAHARKLPSRVPRGGGAGRGQRGGCANAAYRAGRADGARHRAGPPGFWWRRCAPARDGRPAAAVLAPACARSGYLAAAVAELWLSAVVCGAGSGADPCQFAAAAGLGAGKPVGLVPGRSMAAGSAGALAAHHRATPEPGAVASCASESERGDRPAGPGQGPPGAGAAGFACPDVHLHRSPEQHW